MRKIFLLLFLCYVLFQFPSSNDDFFLAGVKVHTDFPIPKEIMRQYMEESIAVPVSLQTYIQEIHIIDQQKLDEDYSSDTSGYTISYYRDGECIASIIYLSNQNFREETLLHEVLHVYDSYQQISKDASFMEIANQEMDLTKHPRIALHYEKEQYMSEYFVESAFAFIIDAKDYLFVHPKTTQYLSKHFKENEIIA